MSDNYSEALSDEELILHVATSIDRNIFTYELGHNIVRVKIDVRVVFQAFASLNSHAMIKTWKTLDTFSRVGEIFITYRVER